MAFEDLPLELVHLIVDYFCDDTRTLKVLSLVSHTCLAVCRTHLFRLLRMNTLNPSFSYKCTLWKTVLELSSAVLPYVRVLELGPPVFQLRARDTNMCAKHWAEVMDRGLPSIHNECIELILHGAIHIRQVTLRFEYQSWENFTPSFQRSIMELLERPSLSSLSIEDVIGFPIGILTSCKRLRDLSLISVESSSDDYDTVHCRTPLKMKTSIRQESLESLTLFASDGCSTSLDRIVTAHDSGLAVSSLQRLSVNMTGSDGQLALIGLSNSASSITTLELRLSDHNGYKVCSLASFHNLRTLALSISYNSLRPLQALALFLSKSKPAKKLAEFSIHLRLDSENSERSSQELTRICTNKDWQLVEHSLIMEGAFPSLSKLNIIFRPRDVATFISDYLNLSLHLCLLKSMPALYALTHPKIEIYDDRFEQYVHG